MYNVRALLNMCMHFSVYKCTLKHAQVSFKHVLATVVLPLKTIQHVSMYRVKLTLCCPFSTIAWAVRDCVHHEVYRPMVCNMKSIGLWSVS